METPVSGISTLMSLSQLWVKLDASRAETDMAWNDDRLASSLAGDDFAGQAARGKVGGHRKCLDHQPVIMRGVPHRRPNEASNGEAHAQGGEPQRHAQPLLEDVEMDLPELFVDVMALITQEGIGLFAAGAGQGQGRRQKDRFLRMTGLAGLQT